MTAADIVFEAASSQVRNAGRSPQAARPLRAFERRENRSRRHHQSRQQAPEKGDGGGAWHTTPLPPRIPRTFPPARLPTLPMSTARACRLVVESAAAWLARNAANKTNVATARELACWCWAVGVHSGIEGRAHHCIKPSITSPRSDPRPLGAKNPGLFLRAPRRHPRDKTVRMTR